MNEEIGNELCDEDFISKEIEKEIALSELNVDDDGDYFVCNDEYMGF